VWRGFLTGRYPEELIRRSRLLVKALSSGEDGFLYDSDACNNENAIDTTRCRRRTFCVTVGVGGVMTSTMCSRSV